MAACTYASPETGLNFGPGQDIRFGNGYGLTVPPKWHGLFVVSGGDTSDNLGPAYTPLKMLGPGRRETVVAPETTAEMMASLESARRVAARDHTDATFVQTSWDSRPVTLAIETAERGTNKKLLTIYVQHERGSLEVWVRDNPDIDDAVGKGVSPADIVALALGQIDLKRTAD